MAKAQESDRGLCVPPSARRCACLGRGGGAARAGPGRGRGLTGRGDPEARSTGETRVGRGWGLFPASMTRQAGATLQARGTRTPGSAAAARGPLGPGPFPARREPLLRGTCALRLGSPPRGCHGDREGRNAGKTPLAARPRRPRGERHSGSSRFPRTAWARRRRRIPPVPGDAQRMAHARRARSTPPTHTRGKPR